MRSDIKINRGLKGIYFERSGISDIDGANGRLTYRGYQISDLARNSTFEEVCYLLIYGNLPNHKELNSFQKKLILYRTLPKEIYKIIELINNGHPMDVLRSCISALPSLIKLQSKYKNYLLFFLVISVIPMMKLAAGPSISAIESIDAATSGFLGGFDLPIILSWFVGAILAALVAFIIGKVW